VPAKQLDIRGYELRAFGRLESRDCDAVSSDVPIWLDGGHQFRLAYSMAVCADGRLHS
jgi:hypothetical protein